ncbi:response regulator [Vibrio sp. D431a]|uniref:response regulator n=1 Tax=Vibrio sp. D431a TaxID=2837388 RepID=UPI002557AE83|nr:response regulator [Vibrio sp. D431a]MDK9793284.1 response regulator [Vibrio sp. D431a]
MKILVIDDFPTMRKIIRSLLGELGYTDIDEAADGLEGLKAMRSASYDLVVSDWNMPTLNGVEMVQQMRKMPDLKDIPVLMVTAEAKREQIIYAAQSGVNGYIVKPFTGATLKEKIDKIMIRTAG